MGLKHPKPEPFLQRHRKVVSIVGALIVFVTFVVKEGMADRWKDQATAIDLARYVESIRAETGPSLVAVQALELQLAQLESRDSKDVTQRLEPLILAYSEFTGQITRLRGELSNVEILLEKMPKEDSDKRRLEELNRRLEKADDEINGQTAEYAKWKLKSAAPMMMDERARFDVQYISQLDKWSTQLGSLAPYWGSLTRDCDEFFNAVVNRAEALRKRNESRAEIAWWLAAVLYAFGWTLAVVGRFYNVPVGGE
jgi:hypothetical protein